MIFTLKKIMIIVFLFVIVLLIYTDENHYINGFIGDRAAGLAGAYTAVADGPEGSFYNPAGLSFTSSRYFSLSVNAIQYKMLKYNNVFYNTDTDFDYTRHSFSFIPNFFGFIQRQKHFTFAVTVACLDSEFYDQRDNISIKSRGYDYDVSGDTYQVVVDASGDPVIINRDHDFNINFNFVDMIYEIGAAFAFLPHEKVSIGFGLYASYRDKKLISQTTYKFKHYDVFDLTASIFTNDRIIGLKPQFGIQVMPHEKLSIGYSISMPFSLVNINSVQLTSHRYVGDDYNAAVAIPVSSQTNIQDNAYTIYNIAENGFFIPAVIKQSLGIAAFINQSLLLSLDGYLYIPLQNQDAAGNLLNADMEKINESQRLRIIGNIAIGIEWYITPNFPLRAGFFTNFTNTQQILSDDDLNDFYFNNSDDSKDFFSDNTNMLDHVNIFGGTLSLGYTTSTLGINIGVAVSGGIGQAQIVSGSANVQRLETLTVNAFISGGYQF